MQTNTYFQQHGLSLQHRRQLSVCATPLLRVCRFQNLAFGQVVDSSTNPGLFRFMTGDAAKNQSSGSCSSAPTIHLSHASAIVTLQLANQLATGSAVDAQMLLCCFDVLPDRVHGAWACCACMMRDMCFEVCALKTVRLLSFWGTQMIVPVYRSVRAPEWLAPLEIASSERKRSQHVHRSKLRLRGLYAQDQCCSVQLDTPSLLLSVCVVPAPSSCSC